MVQMKWVWHQVSKDGKPPEGSICVDVYTGLYQKLKYRTVNPTFSDDGRYLSDKWGEWKDVGFSDKG